MNIERAKELLKLKEKKNEEIVDAEATVAAEEERKVQERLEQDRQEKIKEQKKFMSKIPPEFCKPYAKCKNCNNEVPLTNKAGIKFVDRDFRIIECAKCGMFVIDSIDLNDAVAMSQLEPYVLKLEQEVR
jgi:hypothetical protein